jgi:hypothetical protein
MQFPPKIQKQLRPPEGGRYKFNGNELVCANGS